VNLGTNQVVRTYSCAGTMLGLQTTSSGLTATVPRKFASVAGIDVTAILVVVEGRQQSTLASSSDVNSSPSNIQWSKAQTDLQKNKFFVFQKGRHGKKNIARESVRQIWKS
jgi:hypothetical protein